MSIELPQSSPGHADASVSPMLSAQNPWPGLAAYDEASRDFFNGRSEEADELLRLIRLAPLTVLYGKSGLGKSSLLQAGLFPLLRAAHYLPVNLRIDCSEGADTALERVAQRLMEELHRSKAEFIPRGDESLWEYLHRKDLEIWTTDNFPLTPVLVFDQFEELFSSSVGNSDRTQQILDRLGDLIENRIPVELCSDAAKAKRSKLDLLSQRYRMVLSFREDFLPQVRTWEKKVPSLLRNYLRLEPMPRERAVAAVERSGAEMLEKGVAPVIVDFVGKVDEGTNRNDSAETVIEPVLLSLCCYQLNRQRDGKKIDRALVDRAGRDILDSFYREALADEDVKGPPDASILIENFLIQGDRFRGPYSKEGALKDGLLTERQLAALTDRHRLLRVVTYADTARIELIHDRLVPVVRKARDERKARELQAEQERKAKQAQAELEKERAQRKRAQRSLAVASAAALLILGLLGMYSYTLYENQGMLKERSELHQKLFAGERAKSEIEQKWLSGELARSSMEQKQERAKAQLQHIAKLAEDTSLLAKGEIAFPAAAPPEYLAYRGLAAHRHLKLTESSVAALRALHTTLDASSHLRKVVRLREASASSGTPLAPIRLAPAAPLAYSPDGRILAVGALDGSIHVIDAATHQEKPALNCSPPPGTYPWSIAFNKKGHLAAGFAAQRGDPRGIICVFDLADASVKRRWEAADVQGKSNEIGSIYGLDFTDANGKEIVVAGGSERIVFVGDVESGHLGSLPKRGDADISAVGVSKTGRKIAAAQNEMIRVWDLDKPNEKPKELPGHADTVQVVVFSPQDNSVLVSGGEDGVVKVWNAAEGCETQRAEMPARIYALDINGDGEIVAAGGTGANVRLYRLNKNLSCKQERRNARHGGNPRTSRSANREVPELIPVKDGELRGYGTVLAVAFDRKGDRLASACSDHSIRIWEGHTESFSLGELQLRAADGQRTALPANVTTIAISPEGMLIAAGDDKGNIHLWTAYAEGGLQPATAKWTAHPNAIRSLAYIRNGNRVALISGGEDGVLKVWDAETGWTSAGVMADNAKPVRAIAVSPDGTMLAAGSIDGTVRIWNPTTRALLLRIRPNDWEPGDELNAVGFSPDAKHLVIGSYVLRLIPLAGADAGSDRTTEPEILSGHFGKIRSLKSVPQLRTGDGGRVLSAGKDGAVLTWNLLEERKNDTAWHQEDQFEFRMKAGDGELTAMDASADGRFILTGGYGGQVQLWDGRSLRLIAPRFSAHEGNITAVALAANGSFFVTAEAGKILLWPGPDHWIDIMCQRLSWNISDQQWGKWISDSLEYLKQCENLPKLHDEPGPGPRAP